MSLIAGNTRKTLIIVGREISKIFKKTYQLELGISIAATSVHLRHLRSAGIVNGIKRGLFVYYHLDKKKTAELGKSLSELFKSKGK
jgi:DNA-binding transcriptional ArsR family regulator